MLGKALSRASQRPLLAALRPVAQKATCPPARPPVIPYLPSSASACMRPVHCANRPFLQLRSLMGRSMTTDAGKKEEGDDKLLSSVFGGDAAGAGASEYADGVTDLHQNRHSKSAPRAEGKKILKPWSGATGGTPQTEHMIEVDTFSIKILIGKRGANVQSLMAESGAKIFISQQAGQDSSKRKVAIRGPAEAVAKAKARIAETLRFAETAAVQTGATEVLNVAVEMTGRIIGRQGATIRGIAAETGATVVIDKWFVHWQHQPPFPLASQVSKAS